MKKFCCTLSAFSAVLILALAALPQGELRAQNLPSVTADPGAQGANESVADRSRDLNKLFDDIWQDKLKHQPEYATYLGDKRYDAELTDYSPRAINDALARGRTYIDRLSKIDTTGLPQQEQLSADLMLRSLIEDQEAAPFKEWEMPVNQYDGIQLDLPQLVEHTSFDTADDYDNYIARLGKIPLAFTQIDDQHAERHRRPPHAARIPDGEGAGADPGHRGAEAGRHAVCGAAEEVPGNRFRGRAEAHLRRGAGRDRPGGAAVVPALRQVSVGHLHSQLPQGSGHLGAARRRRLLRLPGAPSTTLDKTPAEIHQIGLDEVKRDEAEMLTIVHKLGFADLKSFSAALKANPKEHPASADALLAAYKGYIAQMQPRLPELFGRLPKAKLEVVPMPAYMAPNQPQAFYDQGTPDGKRPGHVDVNLYNWADRSLADVEAVAYHEGIPGHHLQISIQQELSDLPAFRQQGYYTAYTEGWALYSERLGKEIGFYQDPYSDYGRLEADMWRAIRLVVDTGVHSQHWTRQQMVDYFHQYSTLDETNIQSEVDRYIAWPAQALGYKMGQLKILELRDRAKTALGPKFDLKAFHDVVLDSGALPMDVLEKQVDAWIETQRAAAKPQ